MELTGLDADVTHYRFRASLYYYGGVISRREWLLSVASAPVFAQTRRPNILFAISDDQSFAHAGAAGDRVVKTPAFDRVAESGVLFRNAISASPGCAPSRAAILTGRVPWQLEEAGTHASMFPRKLQVYPELLQKAGYAVGLTGKGAGPCAWKESGWPHNPAGREYQQRTVSGVPEGVSKIDYAANFADFLKTRSSSQPFCFWYGGQEPHRVFEAGLGLKAGKRIEDVKVPPFLPDTREIRSDILDYYAEIEHFDRHLLRMIEMLEKSGELENTLIVATSDNGMAFPGAKATMHEYGIHMPLAVCWPARVKGGRTVDDLVSHADWAPTFLEAAGLKAPAQTTGRSLMNVLTSAKSGQVDPKRTFVLSGRERHSHSRADNLGYPARALRTSQYLYIRNFKPDRWPAGDPPGYYDIDAAPSKSYMLEHRPKPFFEAAYGKQPAEELYDIREDPGCLKNLAGIRDTVRKELGKQLDDTLRAQGDPRVVGNGDVWESYPRHSPMRPELGGFAERGVYNPKYK